MAKLKSSTVLIVLGVALIAIGAAYPFVTLVVDTTPPDLWKSTPDNGVVYSSLTTISIDCKDDESGIASVTATIDSTTYTLTYQSQDPSNTAW